MTDKQIEDIKNARVAQFYELAEKTMRDLIEKDIPYKLRTQIRRTDGVILDVDSWAEYDRKENIIFGVLRDITEESNTRRELEKLLSKTRN